jgi:RNA polymerase sigma-70 factor (ECF subfamily)
MPHGDPIPPRASVPMASAWTVSNGTTAGHPLPYIGSPPGTLPSRPPRRPESEIFGPRLNVSPPHIAYRSVMQPLVVRPNADHELGQLYRDHAGRLWRAVYAYAGDPEVASDAVAEAFAQVLGQGSSVQDPRLWVWKVAFRLAAGELKRRRRFSNELPERAWQPSYLRPEIQAALKALTPRQRATVVLSYWGFSSVEAARILGSSPVTIRVHLAAARKTLRRVLGGDEE